MGLIGIFHRLEQDEYAYRSHHLADKAAKEGKLSDVLSVKIPSRFLRISEYDNTNVRNRIASKT